MIDKVKIWEYMYYDLISNQLEVYLVPSINPDRARNGCCSRAVMNKNPDWYQKFCGLFLDNRNKSIIKRIEILRILERLKDGKSVRSKYLGYLHDINDRIEKELNIPLEDMEYFIEYGELPRKFNGEF